MLLWVIGKQCVHIYQLRNVPGPPIKLSTLILGHFPLIKNFDTRHIDQATRLKKYEKEHGLPLMKFLMPLGQPPVIVIGKYHPILSNRKLDSRRPNMPIKFWKDSILQLPMNNPKYKLHKRLLAPLFSNKNIYNQYLPIINQTTCKLISILKEKRNKKCDILDYSQRFTLDIIGNIGFDYQFNSLSDDSINTSNKNDKNVNLFYYHITSAFDCVLKMFSNPILTGLFDYKGIIKRLNTIHFKFFRDLAQTIIDEKLKNHQEKEKEKDKEKEKVNGFNNILDTLLVTKDKETNERMNDSEIISNIIVLLMAGHETTSNTISWMIYLLAKHSS